MTTNKQHVWAACLLLTGSAACAADSGEQPAAAAEPAAMTGVAGSAAVGTAAATPPTAASVNATQAATPQSSASAAQPATPPTMNTMTTMTTAPMMQAASPSATGPTTPAAPVVTLILEGNDLNKPSDLEFNPYVEGELWVMNQGDSSAVVVSAAGSEQQSAQHRLDVEGARHFMPNPNAFAFGARETTIVDAQQKPVEGTFATCPGVDSDFMGPTLWTPDLRIFALAKSEREAPFNGPDTGLEGPGSHIDMLHSTPTCTGIAWEGTGNKYWSYSGVNNVFVRYDFGKDHGIGNTDHSDGSVWRYAVSGVRYVPNVPGHMIYAVESKLLYMADPGNSRVVSFDPENTAAATNMSARDNVDGLSVAEDRAGGKLTDLVPASAGLKLPVGIALHKGALYVSDYQTSKIHKFSLDGTQLAELTVEQATPNGGLTGLNFGPDGKLYVADMKGNRIFRVDSGL